VDPEVPEGVDPLLYPHERLWKVIDHVDYDQRLTNQYTNSTRIKWPEGAQLKEPADREPSDYFYLLFPDELLKFMLTFTNERMMRKGYRIPIEKAELLKWLGIRLGMALEPLKGGAPAYWKESVDDGVFSRGGDFLKRTGMTFNRFKIIADNLSFCKYHEGLTEDEVRTLLSVHFYL